MLVVHPADLAQVVGRGLVVEVAGQGIARIGGHGQHPAALEQRHGLLEQARLRVLGVDFEVLGHVVEVQASTGSSATRLSRTVSQAPPAPQTAIIAMPIRDQPSGTCENTSQPPSMAKAICVYR